jgi:hypothetical protein
VDLLIDNGDQFDAYEIKFTSTPNISMTRGLAEFRKDFPVNKTVLLNLRQDKLPFSNHTTAEHWSTV